MFLSAGANGQLMDSCDHCDGSAGTTFLSLILPQLGGQHPTAVFFFCLCTFKDFLVTHSGCSDDRKLQKERKPCVSYFRDAVKGRM